MKWKGNDLVRCPVCRVPVQAGVEDRKHYRSHSTLEVLLWHWDNGRRGRVVIVALIALASATSFVVLIRSGLGL